MRKIVVLLGAVALLNSCTYDKGEILVAETPCDSMSYTADIAPLVDSYCNGCHYAGGTGTGDFTTYTELKLSADAGTLKREVFDQKSMPPAASPGLTDAERKKIKCWIEQGAPNN